MELTVDQALKKGVEAHKAGKLKEVADSNPLSIILLSAELKRAIPQSTTDFNKFAWS